MVHIKCTLENTHLKVHDLTWSMALCYYDSVIPKVLNTLSTHKKDPEVLHSANKMHIREYPFKHPQHTTV